MLISDLHLHVIWVGVSFLSPSAVDGNLFRRLTHRPFKNNLLIILFLLFWLYWMSLMLIYLFIYYYVKLISFWFWSKLIILKSIKLRHILTDLSSRILFSSTHISLNFPCHAQFLFFNFFKNRRPSFVLEKY